MFRIASSPRSSSLLSSFCRRNVSSSSSKGPKAAYVPVDMKKLSPMRGLFFGDLTPYATHCVPFPDALTADQRATLAAMVEPVSEFFSKVPSGKIDEEHAIPETIMAGMRDLGLFGLQIAEEYGGLGLSNTAYARMAEEFVIDPSLAVTLMAHQSIGLKGIIMFGTSEQKAKYLPPLASGEKLAAFALTEPTTGSDAAGIKLAATPSPDGKGFHLNGQKMWISNGGICRTYTVFARTPTADGGSKMTAFIANRDEHTGINPGPPEKKLGIRGSNTCVVNFDNVFIPNENVLGEVNGGFKVAMGILNNGRFGMGAASGGGIRKLIVQAADYANNRLQFGRPISQFGLIKEKFARMAVDAYACESMSYMTTALIDGPQLDMSIEAAACKIYGSEAMFRAINDCIQILGGMGFSAGGAYPFERLLRDSRILLIFEGTNEILRLFIGLTAMQAPGAALADMGARYKANPLAAVGDAPALMQRFLRTRLGLGVAKLPGVAPELAKEAEIVGLAVAHLQGSVEISLARHGKNIVEQQMEVQRIANAAIDLYAATAVLLRASLAIKEKFTHANHETLLAKIFVKQAIDRISDNLHGVRDGGKQSGDDDMMKAAVDVLTAGKTLTIHPLRV